MASKRALTICIFFLYYFVVFRVEGLTCNGMTELCDLRINQATFAGTHNSGAGFDGLLYYHTKLNIGIPAISCWYRNQGQSITQQLNSGIKYFDIDTCLVDSGKWERGPWTCHSGAYGGTVSKILRQIDEWMAKNPNEVIVIKFGRDTVHSKAENIGKAIIEQLKDLWEPTPQRKLSKHLTLNDQRRRQWKWPTLGEAITFNQRIFLFMHSRLFGDHDNYYKYRWIHAANYEIGLTWTPMNFVESSGCSKLVGAIKNRCGSEDSYYYDFIEVDLFLTWGLCVKHLADYCNGYIDEVARKCFVERFKLDRATVNFIVVDWAGRSYGTNEIGEVAKRRNVQNVKFFLQKHLKS